MDAPSSCGGLVHENDIEQAMSAFVELDADNNNTNLRHKGWRLTSWWSQPYLRHNRPSKKLHATAYLDGLRGFAAFLVYIHHHLLWTHNGLHGVAIGNVFENGFGYEDKHYFAALSGVRLFFTGGHLAVSIFFVLSGYVLSLKPLRLIENDDIIGLVDHLASAIFRRWLRLYLPIAAVVLIYATSWHLFSGIWLQYVKPHGNWRDEMYFLYCEFKNVSFIFKEGFLLGLSYNGHVWSIPIEFRGSMVIFTTALAISRCTLSSRLWCQVALIIYFMYIADGAHYSMFMAGMLLCHLDLLASTNRLPIFIMRFKPYKKVICYHLLFVGIYLGGVPSETADVDQLARTRGWYLLSLLKPQAVFDYKWFYLFWASVSLITVISNLGWLRRFFESSACQYLGRISYAFYLVHGPVLATLGDRVYALVGFKTQEQMEHIPQWVDRIPLSHMGPAGLEPAFLLPHIILLPVTLALADLVTRSIDSPTVHFATWLYRKTLPSGVKKKSQA